MFFHTRFPIRFENTKDDTIPPAFGRCTVASENSLLDTTNSLHSGYTPAILSIGPEFHTFHVPFFKGELEHEEFTMSVKSASLEFLSVPGISYLCGLMMFLNVIESRASSVALS